MRQKRKKERDGVLLPPDKKYREKLKRDVLSLYYLY